MSGTAVHPRAAVRGAVMLLNAALLLALAVVALAHAWGFLLDAALAVGTPLELDYGEGIVWQQAALIPGPAMYPAHHGLPFIVFHYPPLYHLVARAAQVLLPDPLAAGRLVASLATLSVPPMLAWLAILATPVMERRRVLPMAAILGCCLLLTAMAPVRSWGVLMRVDTLGLALGFAGLGVAALAQGRFWGTLAALMLCLAAVFTKQTMVSFGIAVALLSLLRRPGPAGLAVALVAAIGAALVLWLQALTAGGFLHNILGANVNRLSIRIPYWIAYRQGVNLVLFAAAIGAGLWLATTLPAGDPPGRPWRRLLALRRADAVVWRRALLLVHLGLSCLVLLTLFKVGAAPNYLLELCGAGCVVTATAAAALLRAPAPGARPMQPGWAAVLLLPLIAGAALQPTRTWADFVPPGALAQDEALVRRIRAAAKPVASENMVLLMRAGVPIVYEPAIATELARVGRWDEAPLLAMIRSGGFAFILTADGSAEPLFRRTPAVNAAMLQAYPTLRQLRPGLWLREPPVTAAAASAPPGIAGAASSR